MVSHRYCPGTYFPQRKLEGLDDLGTPVLSIRYSSNGHGFSVPLLVHEINHIFETGRISPIIFRSNDDDPICLVYSIGKSDPFRFGIFHFAQSLIKKRKLMFHEIQDFRLVQSLILNKLLKKQGNPMAFPLLSNTG